MSTVFVNKVQAASNQATTINSHGGTAGITMDTGGRMSFKSPAIVMAGLDSGQNQTINTSIVKINFKTTGNLFSQINTNNVFDNTNNRFIAPVAGIYHVTVSVYDGTANNSIQGLFLYLNGSRIQNVTQTLINRSSTSAETMFGGSAFVKMAASQYLEAHCNATASVTLDSNPFHTYLQIFYAGSE